MSPCSLRPVIALLGLAAVSASGKKTCHKVPGSVVTDGWCNSNCNAKPPYCPAKDCVCDAKKTPLYVVLRMDDVQYGWNSGVQASVVDWALANKVKFNFGIITGPDPNGQTWPTTCSSHPKDTACDDPAVASIYKAYDSGVVAGPNTPAKDAIVEIFNHAWDHDAWSTMSDSQQHADMKKSATALSAAYPKASIKTFVPPQNMADAGTVKAAMDNGLSIISSMGTLACPSDWKGSPPRYNYQYAPCQGKDGVWSEVEDLDSDQAGTEYHDPGKLYYCIPVNDTYVSHDGHFQKTPDGIFSAPTGSANTPTNYVTTGLPVAQVIGLGKCGCEGTSCSVLAAAANNARKSNGLYWTVMMMHPQTVFTNQTYTQWLDEFRREASKLKEWDVKFVLFQDLVSRIGPIPPTPPTPPPSPAPPTPPPTPAPPTPPPSPHPPGYCPCKSCPPKGYDGACCHGNTTCEIDNWSPATCTPAFGTWCTAH